MSVAVPAPNAAGQDALVYSPVAAKPESQKVPELESSGKQRDQRDQERQAPKDHLSERLQSIARLAEKQAAKETPNAQQVSSPTAKTQQRVTEQATARPRSEQSQKPHVNDLRSLHVQSPQASSPSANATQQLPLRAGSQPNPKPPQNEASPYSQALQDTQVRRARQPGPAEVASLPEAVERYDSNGDGRIDQGEMKQVYRAKDERSSYAGLAQPHHPTPETKTFFSEDTTSGQPQKLYSSEEIPLPGEDRGSFAAPLPGTADAEPLYALPGSQENGTPVPETPEQRRESAREQRAQEEQRGQFAADAPPLYVAPEDKAVAEELVATTQGDIEQQDALLQPRKLYDRSEEIDQRDALETYRQVSQIGPGRSSIIA
jgi:hypothetical protein